MHAALLRDAANETTGHENGSACPLNGQRRQAKLSHKGTSYFCALPYLKTISPSRIMQICLRIIVATGSKRLVLGDAACFMKCCHIVRARCVAGLCHQCLCD